METSRLFLGSHLFFEGPVVSPECMGSFLSLSGEEEGSLISAFGFRACA